MKIYLFCFLYSFSLWAHNALVWGGPGACQDGCIEASVQMATLAGLEPMIVTPENFDESLLEKAKIWIQPGGKAGAASKAMGPTIRKAIKQFILTGGGYVGFCAGAFLTTPKVGATRVIGLGIVDGRTTPYRKSKGNVSVQALTTEKGIKYHYWEGGPYFKFSKSQLPKVKVLSRYQRTNQINAIETHYGLGKIAVVGTHPEAPLWWYQDADISDPDQLDHEEAVRMIHYALKSH